MMRFKLFACLGLAAVTFAPAALADPLAGSERMNPGYTPQVPVSALARPLAWFDPSRLQISTSVTMGSNFGASQASQALSVTSFNYKFSMPLEIGLRVGNTYGTGFRRDGRVASSSFFLEGLDIAYRPTPNMLIQFSTRDYRSPLSYGNSYGSRYGAHGPWGR